MTPATAFLSDKDWKNLLREIHSGRVIPVVGPRLVTADDPTTGEKVPLFRYLAPGLAQDLGLDSPEQFASLNDVARSFLLAGHDRKELYIALGDIIERLDVPVPRSLVDLASITDFNLFIASTPDPLMARALAASRPGFSSDRGVIRFHPSGNPNRTAEAPLSGRIDAPCDLPATFSGTLLYHILGDYNTLPDFAIWEEDYMEFICGLLESRQTLENLFRLLGNRDLLLLGAPSDDWIVRFFLRVARGKRLSELPTRGYLADRCESLGEALVFFFDKAVRATRIIDGSPDLFVAELAARWRDAYGATNDSAKFLERQTDDMPPGSVFISYAREDLPATVRVGQALAAAGVPVWFDKQRLKIGENFERSLEHAVKSEASFFLSLISQHTEKTPDRWVHKERAWAAQKHVDGFVFYVPLVIDATQEVRQEPGCFDKIDREWLSDATLPTFVTRMRRLVDRFRDSGHPRG